MLPGGLDIIGIFTIAPPNVINACQIKLKQVQTITDTQASTIHPKRVNWHISSDVMTKISVDNLP